MKWKSDSLSQSGEVWLQVEFMPLLNDESSRKQAKGRCGKAETIQGLEPDRCGCKWALWASNCKNLRQAN